jgi:hypothetical protein
MTSINAAFPVCVLNVQPAYAESFGMASAQRSLDSGFVIGH